MGRNRNVFKIPEALILSVLFGFALMLIGGAVFTYGAAVRLYELVIALKPCKIDGVVWDE